jgi:hypothetical protein
MYPCGNGKKDKKTGVPLMWYCCRSQHLGKKGNRLRCSNSWVAEKKLEAVLVAFTTKTLTDPDLLSNLIAGSLKISSEVIRPFQKPSATDAIIKLSGRTSV